MKTPTPLRISTLMKALTWVLGLSIGVLKAELRQFKDPQGRKVMAELVSHDGQGLLTLNMQNGTPFQKTANQFSVEDQTYIAEWLKRTPATVAYRFDIKAVAEKLSGNRKNMGYKTVKNELWAYKVEIRNTARNPVQNLKVEYRIFVKDEADGTIVSSDIRGEGFHSGDASVTGPLRYNGVGNFTTKEVQIDVVDYRYSSTRDDRHADALRGLMLRIKDADGKVVHEWASPITTLRGKTWDSIPASLEVKPDRN